MSITDQLFLALGLTLALVFVVVVVALALSRTAREPATWIIGMRAQLPTTDAPVDSRFFAFDEGIFYIRRESGAWEPLGEEEL